MDAGEREFAFFSGWTRKEAYVKAIGEGLYTPLESFQVTLRAPDEPRIVHVGGDRDAARAWQVHSFEPAPGYIGALVYRGGPRQVLSFPGRPEDRAAF